MYWSNGIPTSTKGGEPIESQHITHKEPTLAVVLLNSRLQPSPVMKKRICIQHNDQTLQRSYRLNSSLPDAVMFKGARSDIIFFFEASAIESDVDL